MRGSWLVVLAAACDAPADVTPDAAMQPSELAISPGTLDASAVLGLAEDGLELEVTNTGAGTSSPIEATIAGTTDFTIVTTSCTELRSRATCRLVLRFAPTAVGAIDGTVTVSAASGGSATAALHGVGEPVNDLRSSRSTVTSELGYVALGHASTRTITFTISTVGAAATGPLTTGFEHQNGFVKRSDTCSGQAVAAAGASTCAIVVGFDPVAVGQRMTYLAISGNPGGQIREPVQGIGVATDNIIEITPGQGVFANTTAGLTSTATMFTITNTGSVPTGTLATALTIGDGNQFSVTNNTCAGAVLQAAGTCTFLVAFAPTTAGQKLAQLEVTGAGNPSGVTLLGTGI